MTLLRIFITALLAVYHPVPATPAFSQFLARDGGGAPYPEPLIFYNLTREEFTAKLLEHRSANQRASGNSIHLHKREAYLQEILNRYPEQLLLEARNEVCDKAFPRQTHRAVGGYCREEIPRRLTVNCRKKGNRVPGERRERFELCPEGHVCESTRHVINFLGHRVQMPDCRQVLETTERVSNNADVVPAYEGHQSIPGPNEFAPDPNEPAWSPSILDSISTFWEIHDESQLQLTGQWEYYGHYKNGQGFSSRSFGLTHTWSCIGCPAGVLYLAVYGFKTKALGSTFK